MTAQLELSLVNEINDAYDAALKDAEAVRRSASSAVKNAYRCGVMLNQASKAVGKANFPQWLRDHCPKLESGYTTDWMRLAAAVDRSDIKLDDARSMRKLLEIIDVIEHPERQHQQTATNVSPDVHIIRYATNTRTEIAKLIEREPIATWPAMRKLTLKAQLEEFVRLYEQL